MTGLLDARFRAAEKQSRNAALLGALLAICSAATFAFNNASVRRGVLTGTVGQAMAITVPLGLPIFFLVALVSGSLGTLAGFFTEIIGGALGGRHSAFRLGPLLQLPRHARDRHQPRGADPAGQSHLHAVPGDLAARRATHAAEDSGHRARPASDRASPCVRAGKRSRKRLSDEKITAIDAEKPVEFAAELSGGDILRAAVSHWLRVQSDSCARRPRRAGVLPPASRAGSSPISPRRWSWGSCCYGPASCATCGR